MFGQTFFLGRYGFFSEKHWGLRGPIAYHTISGRTHSTLLSVRMSFGRAFKRSIYLRKDTQLVHYSSPCCNGSGNSKLSTYIEKVKIQRFVINWMGICEKSAGCNLLHIYINTKLSVINRLKFCTIENNRILHISISQYKKQNFFIKVIHFLFLGVPFGWESSVYVGLLQLAWFNLWTPPLWFRSLVPLLKFLSLETCALIGVFDRTIDLNDLSPISSRWSESQLSQV